jgi:hypothetical protein
MGSSSKRKVNDTLIIRRPKQTKGKDGGQQTGHDFSVQEVDLNKLCVPSFDVELVQTSKLKEGAHLNLQGRTILLNGIAVGTLSESQKERIDKCDEHGLKYRGMVVLTKAKKYYGRFMRYE